MPQKTGLSVDRRLILVLPVLDRRWRGRFLAGAILTGPEAGGSCPVRLQRDPITRESTAIAGLYPIGEGAGYAGGIVSAGVDGLATACAIISKYAALERGRADGQGGCGLSSGRELWEMT